MKKYVIAILTMLVILIITEGAAQAASSVQMKSIRNGKEDVKISWSQVSGGSYEIYRKGQGGSYRLIYSGYSSSCRDIFPSEGEEVTYRLRVYRKGKHLGSDTKKNVWLEPVKIQKKLNTKKGICLFWDQVKGAEGYRVYKDGACIKKTSASCFVDESAVQGKKATYYILPYKGDYAGVKRSSTTKVYKKPSREPMAVTIGNIGYTVRLYSGNSQAIVDEEDSAAYFSFKGADVIADHNYQGLGRISELSRGSISYILKNGKVRGYQMKEKWEGTLTGKDILDDDGNSIFDQCKGRLVIYTCSGSKFSLDGKTAVPVRVTVWDER